VIRRLVHFQRSLVVQQSGDAVNTSEDRMQGRRGTPHQAPRGFPRLPRTPSTRFSLPLNRPWGGFATWGLRAEKGVGFLSLLDGEHDPLPDRIRRASSPATRGGMGHLQEVSYIRRPLSLRPPHWTVEGKWKRVGWVSGGAGKNFWGLIWFSPPLLTSAHFDFSKEHIEIRNLTF
jgi:hypothetical protein